MDGEDVVLDKDDLLVFEQTTKNAAFSADGPSWIHFDTEISDDLRIEGLMRELMRRLQIQRKDIGLEVEDRIDITWNGPTETVKAIFERFGDLLKSELLAQSIAAGPAEGGATHKLGGDEVGVLIVKA